MFSLNSLNSVTKIFVITVKGFEVHDVISPHFHQRIANAVNDVDIQPMYIQAFQIFDQFDASYAFEFSLNGFTHLSEFSD